MAQADDNDDTAFCPIMLNATEEHNKQLRRKYLCGVTVVGGTLAVGALLTSVRIVRPNQKGLVELLGKYMRTCDAGINFIPPFGFGRMIKVRTDLRKEIIPEQWIITKEMLNCCVQAVAYYQVRDPYRAVYNVEDFENMVPVLAQTTLRNILGKFELAEANSQRQRINTMLREELQSQMDKWGMNIITVELQEIVPDKRVQQSMDEIVIAEQKKIAATNNALAAQIEASGRKLAAIEEAKGVAESTELKARAEANAVIMMAEGEAKSFRTQTKAIAENFKTNVIEFWRLKTFKDSLEKNTKIILPSTNSNAVTFNVLDLLREQQREQN